MKSSWNLFTRFTPMWKAYALSLAVSVTLVALGASIETMLVVVLVFTIFPELTFIGIYHRMYNWRSTEVGQTLMLKSVGMAGLLMLSAARALLGDYPLREFVVYLFFLMVTVSVTFRIPAILKTGHKRGTAPAVEPTERSPRDT